MTFSANQSKIWKAWQQGGRKQDSRLWFHAAIELTNANWKAVKTDISTMFFCTFTSGCFYAANIAPTICAGQTLCIRKTVSNWTAWIQSWWNTQMVFLAIVRKPKIDVITRRFGVIAASHQTNGRKGKAEIFQALFDFLHTHLPLTSTAE